MIALSAGALTLPFAVLAQPQPAKIFRIGVLTPNSPATGNTSVQPFRDGLRELGYIEGKNIVFEYRWGEGNAERLPALAVELAQLKPDVIFATTPQGVMAAKKATTTIPIVFTGVGDPVGLGIIPSLAKPGGNVTGLTNFGRDASKKRVELVIEAVSNLSSIGVLWNSMSPGNALALKDIEAAAVSLKARVLSLPVRGPEDFDRVLKTAEGGRIQALVTIPDPLLNDHSKKILDFAAVNRVPAIYHRSQFVDAGGLMSYAPDLQAISRRAATYVDKILKGARPADLPVEEPTKIVLIVNLKAAKALGIRIPQAVLLRADRVIE